MFMAPKRFLPRLLAGPSLVALCVGSAAAQAPQGGTVSHGQASISQTTRQSTIAQTSQRAVIDWRSFNVGADHHVLFDQPGRFAATLNRVTSGDGSVIAGSISAPGTVMIQNGAGVLFTGSARVDVGGLVAASQQVDADYFQRTGNLRIGGGEHAGARVVNRGRLTIGEAGLAALVGGNVENSGAIVAHRGTVALASGERTTIDMAGDGVFQIAVDGDAEGGSVSHSGTIDARGGSVVLTAGAASGALDGVINTSGLIRASSSTGAGGRVVLSGRGGGEVDVSGRVEAKGATDGGEIWVTGETVRVSSIADLDTSGLLNGGRILLGGDYRGAGELRRASDTILEFGSRVRADGGSGAGGTVVAWADGSTWFGGEISATGGTRGGLVETSGLGALGVGSGARAALGHGGEWLLDPRNVVIGSSGLSPVPPGQTDPPDGSGPFAISASAITATLNAGSDVTVTTNNPSGADAGNVTVQSALNWHSGSLLSLRAANDITIDGPIQTPNGGFGAVPAGTSRSTPRSGSATRAR